MLQLNAKNYQKSEINGGLHIHISHVNNNIESRGKS